MHVLGSVLLAVTGVLCVGACGVVDGKSCTAIAAYGLNVRVQDASTQAAICSAVVEAKEGTHTEKLMAVHDCVYVGAIERAGTYTVTASAAGYQTKTMSDVTVTADECHVEGRQVTLELARKP